MQQIDIVEVGIPGPTPRLTVGQVETLEPGSQVEVELTGSPRLPVLNFGIPEGRQGLPGVNAIENDQAVAAYMLDQDSETRAALPGAIGKSQPGGVPSLDAFGRMIDAELPSLVARSALGTAPSAMGPLATCARRARAGQARVALYGMSIASFTRSPIQVASRVMQAEYGYPNWTTVRGFFLGGTIDAPHRGWRKQRSGAVGYGHAVADSTSLPIEVAFYGDTVRLTYGRHSDAEQASFAIDGATVGQSPAAGSQTFGLVQTFSVPRGAHVLTINPPTGGGRVYLERYDCGDSTVPGVIVEDNTLGGSRLADTYQVQPASGQQIASQPIEGQASIVAHFDRSDVDAIIVAQDVNDAGSSPLATFLDSYTLPALAEAVARTGKRGVPLVLVSSMAGHYAMPNDGGTSQRHDNYERLRAAYRDAAAANSHVTHVDWHAATILADLAEYARRYYPAVSNLNVAAGTYSGDFIHPDSDLGYHAGIDVTCAQLHLPTPRQVTWSGVIADLTRPAPKSPARVASRVSRLVVGPITVNTANDTFTTSSPHGLSSGDAVMFTAGLSGVTNFPGQILSYVVDAATPNTFRLSLTPGGAVIDMGGSPNTALPTLVAFSTRAMGAPVGGARRMMVAADAFAAVLDGVYRESSLHNFAGPVQAEIDASGTSDRWGRYIVATAKTLSLATASPAGSGVTVSVTIRFTGSALLRAEAGTTFLTPDGSTIGRTNAAAERTDVVVNALDDSEPTTLTILAQRVTAGTPNVYVTAGRLYEVTVAHGTAAILT